MVPLDIAWVRAQFPALDADNHQQPLIFFDGPGGTQVPGTVIAAMQDYLIHANANAHGAFATSERTDQTIAAARSAIADLIGCGADEIVFGSNMTTLTFAFSRAIGRVINPGDEIVVTRLDHDANITPWCVLEERGAVIRFVEVNTEDCTLDMASLRQHINERTRLVAVGYASNAVGTINDVAEVVRLAHEVGAWVFVDAVHAMPHVPIDVKALDCDFLACSAYKFFGPHVGVIYGKRELLEQLQPYKLRPSPNQVPYRWETGTQNHEGLAGLVAAIAYLEELGHQVNPSASNRRGALVSAMQAIHQYEQELAQVLVGGLVQVPGLRVYGITDGDRFGWRTPTVAVRHADHTPQALARALGDRGICTWNGSYYAIHLAEKLGVESSGGMVRIGLVHYNTVEEVHGLLKGLGEIVG